MFQLKPAERVLQLTISENIAKDILSESMDLLGQSMVPPSA